MVTTTEPDNPTTEWKPDFARALEIAARAERAGNIENAISVLRDAADRLVLDPDDASQDAQIALACGEARQHLGELLWNDRLPESAQAFQGAADAFGMAGSVVRSAECARRVVQAVRILRERPSERLDLLIVRYDQELRQLELIEKSETAQGDLLFKVGTILQRRDRFELAADRYKTSLEKYQSSDDTELSQARVHHRLGDLFQHELNDLVRARGHYLRAIEIYGQHEPEWEGEQMNRVLCEWHMKSLIGS